MTNGHLEYLDVRMRAVDPQNVDSIARARSAIAELRERGYRVACDNAERRLIEMIDGPTPEDDEDEALYWQRAETEFQSWVKTQEKLTEISKQMDHLSRLTLQELKALKDDILGIHELWPDWLMSGWGDLELYLALYGEE